MKVHELIKALQDLGEAAQDMPVKVPYHQQYDSTAALEEANLVSVHVPDPWGKREPYVSIRRDNEGSEMWT